MSRQPPQQQPPPVQRLRVRYTKRGRLRFTSHRDFSRAFERAVARARLPMAYSSGFHPHPRISYAGAAPTGSASEAEYLEIGLASRAEPDDVRLALDEALPPGLDVLEVVESAGGSLADLLTASRWVLELAGVDPAEAQAAVTAFLDSDEVPVERMTKKGLRTLDARSAVVSLAVEPADHAVEAGPVRLALVLRHLVPAVRPDDVLSGLAAVADLRPTTPPLLTRVEQGTLAEGVSGDLARIDDPLATS